MSEANSSRVRGRFDTDRENTPHPPSLRSGTLSHKGRGKEGVR
jgi:hypothetical protein